MTARDAAKALGMSPQQFGQALLAWLEELQVRPNRILVLEEHLSAQAFAERVHLDKATAHRIFAAIRPRRELSRKCVRVPASALASFLATKKLPKRKAQVNGPHAGE